MKHFKKTVFGINLGNIKTATIPAEQAYEAHRPEPEMAIEADRQQLPPTWQLYVGQRLQMTQQDGTSPVMVLVMAVPHGRGPPKAGHSCGHFSV
jgi:FKBP-type peptidyl-prolyl cis-trans isomerase 2